MIFHPLDLAEIVAIGRAVHHGAAVLVDTAAVKRDHGVPQAVGKLAADPSVPRELDRAGDLFGEVLGGFVLHQNIAGAHSLGEILGKNVVVRGRHRGVGVGRGDDQFLFGAEAGKKIFDLTKDRLPQIEPNRAQIDRNENRAVERPIPVARLQGNRVGGHRRGGALGDAGTHLSLQEDGAVRGKIDRGGADIKLRAAGRGGREKDTGKRQDETFKHRNDLRFFSSKYATRRTGR